MNLIFSQTYSTGDMAVWWREKGAGYTTDVLQAGKYSNDEAQKIENEGIDQSIAIPLEDLRPILRQTAYTVEVENLIHAKKKGNNKK